MNKSLRRLLIAFVYLLCTVNNYAQTPANALKFDPSLSITDVSRLNYVSIANPFRDFNKEMTVEFWMYVPNANMPFGSLMGQGNSNVDNNWVWLLHPDDNGKMTFYVNDAGTFRTSTCNILANAWHHYAAVTSATGTKFYIDGEEAGSVGAGVSSKIYYNNTAVVHIGKDVRYATRHIANGDPWNRYATMTLDELRIWSRALCKDEIKHNMNCELNPVNQNKLEQYYNFNKGVASGNNTGDATLTELTDQSGNNRHGVLNNFSLNGANSNWVASSSTNTGTCTEFVPSAAPITGTTTICLGSGANTTALSNANANGQWTSSNTTVATIHPTTGVVTGLTEGNTTITYTTPCGAVSTATITVSQKPTVTISSAGGTTSCPGNAVILNANAPGVLNFQWYKNGVLISGPTTPSYNATVTGSYTAVATKNGCVSAASNAIAIVIEDVTKPTITCAQNINVPSTSLNGAVVNYSAPVVSDNCSAVVAERTAGLASGSVFPIGTTTVTHRVVDKSGNEATCSFTVTVTAPTQSASALNFDGADDYVAINNPFKTFSKEITVSFWMNAPNAIMPYGSIMGQSTSGVDNMSTNVWLMHPNTVGGIDFLVNDAGTWRGATVPIRAGGWHHYVGVSSEFGTKFYVDGVLEATGPQIVTGIVNNANSVIHIGKDPRHNAGRFGNSTIDEIRIWSRALCEEEIKSSINCELNPSTQTDLQEYYRFNQGFVDYNNFSETTLFDASGNGRDGQLTNMSLSGANSNWVESGSTNNGICSNFVVPAAPITGTNYICIGGTSTLYNAYTGGLWSSSNTAVATIDAKTGVVTTVSGGFTIITYKNQCGGISTITVVVTALNAPVISTAGSTNVCPGTTVTLTAPGGFGIRYQWYKNGVAIDGSTSSSYIATVSGNYTAARTANGCSSAPSNNIVVAIQDIIKPVISCPSNQALNLNASCSAILPDYRSLLTVSDNCTPTNLLTITQAPLPGTEVSGTGDMLVTFNVTDAYGNTNTCKVTVNKRDVTNPTINCPENVTVTATSASGTVVNYDAPVATDNCSGVTMERIAGLASGATFPIGTTTVTYMATDAAGNKTSCSFTVTVVGVAPEIICPANITVNAAVGQCSQSVQFSATESKGIPASIIKYIANGQPVISGDNFPVGTTTVYATASNAIGTSTCSFTITVVDNQPPSITAPASVEGKNTTGLCTGTVDLGTPITSDNCGTTTVTNDAPEVFPVGKTVVTWKAKDLHNNITTATQVVEIFDQELPTIRVANKQMTNDAGKCGATVSIQNPETSDNCGVASVEGVRSDNKSITAEYPVGTTTITWTVTDVHGNKARTTQLIEVSDAELPAVRLMPVTVQLDVNGQAGITTEMVNNGSTDNCGIAKVELSKTQFNCSNVGANSVVVTVYDIHGNSASSNTTVTVQDNIAPTVITKAATVTLINGGASITANDVNDGSYDNCGIAKMVVTPNNFNCSNIGTNTVTLTITDVHGNISSKTVTVTVIGQVPTSSIKSVPTSNVFTGGNVNTLYLGYGAQSTALQVTATGGSSYTYQWTGEAVSMLNNTNSSAPVFTPTAPGLYTFNVIVTNNFGCTSTSNITICVKDIRVPGNKGGSKVYICHVPPGNSNNPQTLEISVNAVASHLGQHAGDKLGSCGMTACFETNPVASTGLNLAKAKVEELGKSESDELAVLVMPNPSSTYFTLKLQGKSQAPIQLRVIDLSGRVIESKARLAANATIEIGHNYLAGQYIAEFLQGNKRKLIRLLKVK